MAGCLHTNPQRQPTNSEGGAGLAPFRHRRLNPASFSPPMPEAQWHSPLEQRIRLTAGVFGVFLVWNLKGEPDLGTWQSPRRLVLEHSGLGRLWRSNVRGENCVRFRHGAWTIPTSPWCGPVAGRTWLLSKPQVASSGVQPRSQRYGVVWGHFQRGFQRVPFGGSGAVGDTT